MAEPRFYPTVQGDMIDLVAWKYYAASSGYVEGILESPLNYRLCDLPETFEAGVTIALPDMMIEPPPLARLWDPQLK